MRGRGAGGCFLLAPPLNSSLEKLFTTSARRSPRVHGPAGGGRGLQEKDNKKRCQALRSRCRVALSRFCEFNVHMSEAPRARVEEKKEEGEEEEFVQFQAALQ